MEYLTEKEILAVNKQVIRKAGEGVYGLQYPEGLIHRMIPKKLCLK